MAGAWPKWTVAGVSMPMPEMAMVIVVPGEESLAEGVAVLQAAEAIGELRAIFHGAKLAF